MSAPVADPPARFEREIAGRMVPRIVDQHQVRERAWRRLERAQRKVRPDVAVQDQERLLAEQRQRRIDAAAGAERFRSFRAVADRDAARRAVAERLADPVAEPGQVDHDFANAEIDERGEVVLDEAVAADLEQRFRQFLGQRAHALAAPAARIIAFNARGPRGARRP